MDLITGTVGNDYKVIIDNFSLSKTLNVVTINVCKTNNTVSTQQSTISRDKKGFTIDEGVINK